jgi:hypothetical protein
MRRLGLTKLRFRQLNEMLSSIAGRWHYVNKTGRIRYGRTILRYVFKPKFTSLPEFCIKKLQVIYKIPSNLHCTIDQIIDMSYSNFILEQYDLSTMGANHRFNTIRNVLKYNFRSKEYMINHYSNKLSLPVIKFLKKDFADRDYLNIAVPAKIGFMAIVRSIESGIRDHVRKEFSLVRAGPYTIRSPLVLVA